MSSRKRVSLMMACTVACGLPACDWEYDGSLFGPTYRCNSYLRGLSLEGATEVAGVRQLSVGIGGQVEFVLQSRQPLQEDGYPKECKTKLPAYFPTIEMGYSTERAPYEVVGVDGVTGWYRPQSQGYFTRTFVTMNGPGDVRVAVRGLRAGESWMYVHGYTSGVTQDAAGLFTASSYQIASTGVQIRVTP